MSTFADHGTEAQPVRLAEPWQRQYQGDDVTGEHVIAVWDFDAGQELTDAGGKGFDLTLTGAKLHPEGRFGGCLESFRGHPIEDTSHGARVAHSPALSPEGPFTIEMWIKPKPEIKEYPSSFLLDKKYVSHTDYQLILGAADRSANRTLQARLGFGADSATFTSDPAVYAPGVWTHIAFTYDAAGNGRFYRDGASLGGTSHADRKAVVPGNRPLTIGDRNGSLYHGFPGYIDQVRLCQGVLEFRPAEFVRTSPRTAFVRMEQDAAIEFTVTNKLRTELAGAVCLFGVADASPTRFKLPALASGATHTVRYTLDTSLRPDRYKLFVRLEIPGETPYVNEEHFAMTIAPRPLPRRMPVIMWGVYGIENVAKEIDTLKDLGFTHCLGAGTDFGRIWEAGEPTQAHSDEAVAQTREMLDAALAADLRVVASLSPGRWAKTKEQYRRLDRNGKPQDDVNGLYPEIQQFCFNVGASVARTFGEFPALDGALVHTEVRGHSRTSFAEIDHKAFMDACGLDIPEQVGGKNGVRYTELETFPPDRVIADDDPLYIYYKWFWEKGDGWNALHSALHRGLNTAGEGRMWTFHDPAVRAASKWGSGGEVDVLSQWTYSYPDPIRIGLATDELFAMAGGAAHEQNVMKMTQIIWYRNQTAPMPGTEARVTDAFFDDQDHGPGGEDKAKAGKYRARWEREIPGAPFITIAPMHLREAFWAKIARPIQGIMYHGWQSLVPDRDSRGYCYTHPGAKEELRRLVRTVVEPLGPTLVQVPDRASDVAFLESFAAQMFARRGTYGWNGGWAGDAYLILHYAQLQPQVVYEETIAREGLDRFKVLVMVDCDVLPRSIVAAVRDFQARGGIVIGDENLPPVLHPDILLQTHVRPREADHARRLLQEKAAALRQELDPHYVRYQDSSNADVITRCRRYENADYLFLINDSREYGNYVGHHGLVMENGLPSETLVSIRRKQGYVYDLVAHRQIEAHSGPDGLRMSVNLGPCEGRVYMITDQAVGTVRLDGPDKAERGSQVRISASVLDRSGQPVRAIVPVQLDVLDPGGQPAEFSGHYAAKDGQFEVTLDIAPNDVPGVWTIHARELASGRTHNRYLRITP